MQFPVPQFIDIEDKIIGPFTLKQFGFLFGGGLVDVALFKIFGLGVIFFIVGLPITIVALYLSFGVFNGKPAYDAIPVFLRFVSTPKKMVFHHQQVDLGDIQISPITAESLRAQMPKTDEVEEPAYSRLQKLSVLLDQKNQEENETLSTFNAKTRRP